MNCSDLSSLARQGLLEQRLDDSEVLAHLRECGACEALYAGSQVGAVLANEAESSLDFDLDALRSALDAELDQEAKDPTARIRELPLRARLLLIGAVAGCTILGLAATWTRADWGSYPAARMWVTLGALAVTASFVLRELLRPLTTIERPRVQQAWLLGGVLTPVLFAVLPHGLLSSHSALSSEALLPTAPHSFVSGAAACLAIGVGLLLPTAACVVLALRSAARETHAVWLVAGFLGLVGNVVLQVHCPFTDLMHLLFGHALLSVVWFALLWTWSRARSVA